MVAGGMESSHYHAVSCEGSCAAFQDVTVEGGMESPLYSTLSKEGSGVKT